MAGKLNLKSGCRGNAGLDGRIQILFSRHEYSSPQGRLSYNNKPLGKIAQYKWELFFWTSFNLSSRKF